ncbi:MAG: sortase, partial [Actinobacteria bacterium]|nr:sortase [Actinomycetota bacterium]
VVEGSSSRDLMNGPGHLPATVLPGQAGVSTILGKGTTFGAPFRRLLTLQPGDRITATTGQGVSTYVVSSFGDSDRPPPANSANRLLLVTGSGGSAPGRVVIVSADLVSPVQIADTPAAARAVDRPRARDTDDSLVPLAGWSQLLLLVAIVGTYLFHRAPRWPVLLCLGPVVLAVVWNVYENAAGLLPNVV